MRFIEKKRIKSPKMINIDKNKDIDSYVKKLADIINNKIKLMITINIRINSIMSDINNISNMVNKNMDNDTLHLIDDILNKFIGYLIIKELKKNFKKTKNGISFPDQLPQDT